MHLQMLKEILIVHGLWLINYPDHKAIVGKLMDGHELDLTNLSPKLGMKVEDPISPFQILYDVILEVWNANQLIDKLVPKEARLKQQNSQVAQAMAMGIGSTRMEREIGMTTRIILPVNLWINSGSNVHVSNSMQGFLTTRNISLNEACLYMENRIKASIVPYVQRKGYFIDCINGNQIKHIKKGATRKIYIAEVEKQLHKKVKARFDRGGKYYGKYDDSRQCRGCRN
ncbi:hypothetical protein V2J09_015714 [Rumex salicifolius]